MKPWLTVGEGAEYANVSRDTIYTACERHELRHVRISGRRTIRVKPAWIDAWLEQHARELAVVLDVFHQQNHAHGLDKRFRNRPSRSPIRASVVVSAFFPQATNVAIPINSTPKNTFGAL